MGGAEDPDEEFRPPLPLEDRLWRHPSEVAAEGRATATVSVATVRTSWKQAVGLAAIGAVGGALVVTGLFLTLGGSTTPTTTAEPIFSTVALDPVVPVVRTATADQWADEVVDTVRPGVVEIMVTDDRGAGAGSGVLIRSDGVLLTSHDLVARATDVRVVLDGTNHAATVLGYDDISGLAVVAVDANDTPTAPLAIVKHPPMVGDHAAAVPSRDSSDELSPRTIAATSVNVPIRANQDLHGLIQLDGPLPGSSSGTAVIDNSGAVIGIAIDTDSEHATYAVPIGYARRIAEEIIRYGEAKHAWLGIKGVDLDGERAASEGVDGAVRIASVIEGSPASRAQLRKGDVITSIDGRDVLSMSELILELRRHPPETAVDIRFRRDGDAYRVTLTLAVRSLGDTT